VTTRSFDDQAAARLAALSRMLADPGRLSDASHCSQANAPMRLVGIGGSPWDAVQLAAWDWRAARNGVH